METPKIIHQIWSDLYKPLPAFFEVLSETWKKKHLGWEYILWSEQMMRDFVKKEYPEYYEIYMELPYDMQRWDVCRFLILNKMGGVHVDTDYECLENIEPLIENTEFSIALEPALHCKTFNVKHVLNSALMASIPNHFFLKKVIERVLSKETFDYDRSSKPMYILNTTGPLVLSNLYESLSPNEKEEINLIPAKYVTPFDGEQIKLIKAGIENDELENCLNEAYAVHYFTNLWV